jgi:hypothetical protein
LAFAEQVGEAVAAPPRVEAYAPAVAEFTPIEPSIPQEIDSIATPLASTTHVEFAMATEEVAAAIAPTAAEPAAVPEIAVPPVIAEPVATIAVPVEVPQPAALPPPAPAVVDVSASLQQAGLVMIETVSTPLQAAIVLPAPTLGRKPKIAPPVASEPLQMVETQRN